MSEEINKSRKPTPADLKILAWLESGQSINNLEAIQKFKNAMLRDAIWRLKGAGYPIKAEWMKYETADKVQKKYKMYYITKPTILPAGHKTQKQVEKAMGEKGSIPEISRQIQKVASSVQLPLL